jgi:predicted dehydrogenase
MSRTPHLTRRQFVSAVAAASLGGPLLLNSTRGADDKKSPNDRVALGFIGVGTMGRGHLGGFLGDGNVQVVAVCDVVKDRRDDAKRMTEERYGKDKKTEYKGCESYSDFRKLLERKDIDAVVIATPDHWHAIPCIMAARAGKDIYCEKPLTHNIGEGKVLIEAVRNNKVAFQTGSQQRSEFGGHFRKAVEYVWNGRIGKLKTIRIGVGDPARPCDLPEQEAPDGTDWDTWNGPSPKRGYNETLCPKGIHKHFPAWRVYGEYGGGGLADMGAHHFDIAQWAMQTDLSGPSEIIPPEDKKKKSGLRFVYPSGIVMIHNEFDGGPQADCVFIGSEGTILVTRNGIKSDPASILKEELGDKAKRVYPSTNHHKNWIECIRSRKDTICPAEVGHRSASICNLGNIGYQLRRTLKWDAKEERFIGDDEANRLLSPDYRKPWTL